MEKMVDNMARVFQDLLTSQVIPMDLQCTGGPHVQNKDVHSEKCQRLWTHKFLYLHLLDFLKVIFS